MRSPAIAPTRVVLERTAAATTELLISVDERGAILTKREMHRGDALDLPKTMQMVLPITTLSEVVAALEAAARAARGDDA